MRSFGVIAAIFIFAGCKSAGTCSARVGCAAGSYQTCGDGSDCRIEASDGSRFDCASCGDCQGAVVKVVAWCGSAGTAADGGGVVVGDLASLAKTGMQPQACIDYLSCAAQYAAAEFPTLLATYGPSGACWQGDPSEAAACTSACVTALEQARHDPSAPAVCNPIAVDMAPATTITVAGDAASGYGTAVLSSFTCLHMGTSDAVIHAAMPDQFPSSSPASNRTLQLFIQSGLVGIDDPTIGSFYATQGGDLDGYGAIKVTASGQLPSPPTFSIVLYPSGGATGTLTVTGGWRCP